ncbi:CHAD domain-containing protein [Azospirillum sp. SYSU D00513]|uniref:CHAD domain-containing protein n=1 Tax=Azospirillum sp. SYSU D00513 TaxID=2812561 RepID=UPI001A9638F7|nr:CHAD domain-containing protein [Azospirillum sp. SYSU D00513]
MAYELVPGETCDAAVRRIVGEQLGGAADALQRDGSSRHEAVHEARKACKKARAALRLARGSMEEKPFRRLNAAIRDAQGKLSGARDSAVIIQTLDKLRSQCGEELAGGGIDAFREVLVERCRRVEAEQLSGGDAFEPVVAMLRSAQEEAGRLPIDGKGFDVLRPGLRRIYRTGRSMRNGAFRDSETAHEWRKQAKNLWYTIRLMEPVWPGPLGCLGGELEDLSERLGDHHDLAVLLHTAADAGQDEATVAALRTAVERRQGELERKGALLGEKIFAERTDCFLDRMEAYWSIWNRKARDRAAARRPVEEAVAGA